MEWMRSNARCGHGFGLDGFLLSVRGHLISLWNLPWMKREGGEGDPVQGCHAMLEYKPWSSCLVDPRRGLKTVMQDNKERIIQTFWFAHN